MSRVSIASVVQYNHLAMFLVDLCNVHVDIGEDLRELIIAKSICVLRAWTLDICICKRASCCMRSHARSFSDNGCTKLVVLDDEVAWLCNTDRASNGLGQVLNCVCSCIIIFALTSEECKRECGQKTNTQSRESKITHKIPKNRRKEDGNKPSTYVSTTAISYNLQ